MAAILGEIIELELNDDGANHHKYYRAYRFDSTTVFQWGRIGANPQNQRIDHGTKELAQSALFKKVSSKTSKGYGYTRDIAGALIPPDILELDPSWRDRGTAAVEQSTSVNPFEAFGFEVDRCRRLAMGSTDQLTEAVVLRKSLNQQLDELRTSVLTAEGGLEVVDMLIGAKF